jgi:hypothetical protein
MTVDRHPITPPPEMVQQWIDEPQYMTEDQLGKRMNLISMNEVRFREIIDKVSQYGADMELAACCEWLFKHQYDIAVVSLRAARRPPAPDGAIAVLDDLDRMFDLPSGHYNTLLSALTALPQ